MNDKTRLAHARRVLAECKNPRLMLQIATRYGIWGHVNWDYVKTELAKEGK